MESISLDLLAFILGRYGWKNTKNIALTCKRFNEASCKPQYWEKAIFDKLTIKIKESKLTFVEPEISNVQLANILNPFNNLFCNSVCQNPKEYLTFLFIDNLFYIKPRNDNKQFYSIYISKYDGNRKDDCMVITYILKTWNYTFGTYIDYNYIIDGIYLHFFKNSDCYRKMITKYEFGYNRIYFLEYFDSEKNKTFYGMGKWQDICINDNLNLIYQVAVPDGKFGIWV